jgi:hypothetical protein
MSMAHRVYADEQTRGLFELAAELADKELRPAAAAAERDGTFRCVPARRRTAGIT